MSYNSLLNKTCTIQTKTVSYSATGASTKSFANKVTNVKCTIQPKKGRMRSSEQGEELNITHIGFFKIGTNIVESDKVIDGASSYEYIVGKVPNDAAGRAHHLEVGLELLNKG